MKISTSLWRLPVLLAALICVTLAQAGDTSSGYVQSVVGDSARWGGTSWTTADLDQFDGEPETVTTSTTSLLLRYSYFTSNYDTAKMSPIWVAHIDTANSAKAAATRKGGIWDRGQYKFHPDANVVEFDRQHQLDWVTDADYTNANPSIFRPVTAKNRITRGHMASNLEMKGNGADDDAGMLSQKESFSFANVCPQMQGHNAPLWSTLEGDCLMLAGKLGRVAVITGPVYEKPTAQLPTTAAPKGKCAIPIPTHFFKVIIATVDGHTEALAFLIPHVPNLTADQLLDYAVSVREVEKATGINFMPKLGRNDDVEDHPSDQLLDLLQKD